VLVCDPEIEVTPPSDFTCDVKKGDRLTYAIRVRALATSPVNRGSSLSLWATFADQKFASPAGIPRRTWGCGVVLNIGTTSTQILAEEGPS